MLSVIWSEYFKFYLILYTQINFKSLNLNFKNRIKMFLDKNTEEYLYKLRAGKLSYNIIKLQH